MDGKLYVMVLRRKPSFLLCIDPATGDILWKRDRPTDAEGESPESYASPIAATIDGKSQVVCYGGDAQPAMMPRPVKNSVTQDINPTNNKCSRDLRPTQGSMV